MSLRIFLLLAWSALAADAACAAGYSGPHYRLNLPGPWSSSTADSVTTYRSEAGLGVVTVAVYALKDPGLGAAQRGELLLRARDLSLRAERELGGPGLELRALPQQRQGGLLRARYRGREPASGRRFASFMVSSPGALHSLYYEAQGLSERRFARLAGEIERGLQLGAAPLARGNLRRPAPPQPHGLLPLQRPLPLPLGLLP